MLTAFTADEGSHGPLVEDVGSSDLPLVGGCIVGNARRAAETLLRHATGA